MSVAIKITVHGMTRLKDSMNKVFTKLEPNSIQYAQHIGELMQDRIIRNSRTMIPHKYSTINRLNGSSSIPLEKSINLVRGKKREYNILVPRYAIYLDQGTRMRVVRKSNPMMKFLNTGMQDVYTPRVIHPGNPAYSFITFAQAQLPKMIEDETKRLLKKNQSYFK